MSDAAAKRPYYVTTAILYANASPHVGHTFELIGADVMARAKRMPAYARRLHKPELDRLKQLSVQLATA